MVGTCTKILSKNKPLITYDDRLYMLKHCKYIDKIVENVPYITTTKILEDNECEYYCHGNEDILTKQKIDPLKTIKKNNKLIIYNITNGISTTNLLYRLYLYNNNNKVKTNLDNIYLNYIFNKLKPNFKEYDNIIYLYHSWDLFGRIHIEYIIKIKSEYPNYKIITIVKYDNTNLIYNQLERAIVLCCIKEIDGILLEDKNNLENISYINVQIDDILYKKNIINNIFDNIDCYQNKLNKEINKNLTFEKLAIKYINNNLYFDILKDQYNIIEKYIKNITFDINDVIVFDIDEVCLLNLMYINNFTYSFLYDKYNNNLYNYSNGFNPIIEECKNIFTYLHNKNIKYIFVTGRKDYIREITINNLKLVGLDNYIDLYTCSNDFCNKINIYKNECYEQIQLKYNIICIIGDQISDLKFNIMSFLIFNPFYYT